MTSTSLPSSVGATDEPGPSVRRHWGVAGTPGEGPGDLEPCGRRNLHPPAPDERLRAGKQVPRLVSPNEAAGAPLSSRRTSNARHARFSSGTPSTPSASLTPRASPSCDGNASGMPSPSTPTSQLPDSRGSLSISACPPDPHALPEPILREALQDRVPSCPFTRAKLLPESRECEPGRPYVTFTCARRGVASFVSCPSPTRRDGKDHRDATPGATVAGQARRGLA